MLLHLIAAFRQSPRHLALSLSSSLSSSASVQCGLAPIPSPLCPDQIPIKHQPTDRLTDRPTDRIFRFWSCLFGPHCIQTAPLPAVRVSVTLITATLRTLSVRSLVGCCTADSSLHTRTSSCLPALVGVFLGCVSHSEASLAYQRSLRATIKSRTHCKSTPQCVLSISSK